MGKTPAAKAPAPAAGKKAAADSDKTPVSAPEKTAPLPQKKWTLKRWLLLVVAPAVVVIIGLIMADLYLVVWPRDRQVAEAVAAQQEAVAKFRDHDFTGAARGFEAIVEKYKQVRDVALYAQRYGAMARAEEALAKEDWNAVDASLALVEARGGAEPTWRNDFDTRYRMARDIKEKMAAAEAYDKGQDWAKAIAILTDVRQRYPNLPGLADRIAVIQDKVIMNQYRDALQKGKTALSNRQFADALARFNEAQLLLPKLQKTTVDPKEVAGLIDNVMRNTGLQNDLQAAEVLVSASKFAEALAIMEPLYVKYPFPSIQKRINEIKAAMYLQEGKALEAGGDPDGAYLKYKEVLKYDPASADARKFVTAYELKKKQDDLIKAGDEAMTARNWAVARDKYLEVEATLPADQAAIKDALDAKIKTCKYSLEFDAGEAAVAAKKFGEAIQHYEAASLVDDTQQEAKDKLELAKKLKQVYDIMDTARQLMEKLQFIQAEDALKPATKLIDTDPALQKYEKVADLKKECGDLQLEITYRRCLAKGKENEAVNQLIPARTFYRMARTARETQGKDTTEIKMYLDRVEKKIKALPPEKTATE
jgi:hypothetical protein